MSKSYMREKKMENEDHDLAAIEIPRTNENFDNCKGRQSEVKNTHLDLYDLESLPGPTPEDSVLEIKRQIHRQGIVRVGMLFGA